MILIWLTTWFGHPKVCNGGIKELDEGGDSDISIYLMTFCLEYCVQAWEPHFKKGTPWWASRKGSVSKQNGESLVKGSAYCYGAGDVIQKEECRAAIIDRMPALHVEVGVFKQANQAGHLGLLQSAMAQLRKHKSGCKPSGTFWTSAGEGSWGSDASVISGTASLLREWQSWAGMAAKDFGGSGDHGRYFF